MSSDKETEVVGKSVLDMDHGVPINDIYREKKIILEKLARNSILKRRVLAPFLEVFKEVEAQGGEHGSRVSDVVIGADTFNDLRKYAKDEIDINYVYKELIKRFMGSIWGAMVWIAPGNPKEIYAFKEDSKKFEELFPEVFKCKVELFLGDKK